MDKRYLLFAISIFIFFFLIFYLFPNFLLTLELRLHDSFVNVARSLNRSSAHKDEIVIIALDDMSCFKMQKKWPYPRTTYADLLNRISKGSPRIVVFDIVFQGDSENKKDDELLFEALSDKSNVLLPYHLGRLGVDAKPKDEFVVNSGSAGYINKPVDIDGAIRRFSPFILTIDNRIRDFGVELYLFARYYKYDLRNIALKNRQVFLYRLNTDKKDMVDRFDFDLHRDNTIWLNYQAKMDDFNVISMFRVLSDNFNPQTLKDKIVLIGATADIFHDIHSTPFGLMPGTAIIANAALMFLDGRFIYDLPEWLKWLIIFVCCILMVLSCYRCSILKGLLFTIAIITIVVTLTFTLFIKGYYFNPFKLILICTVAYIAVNFYKYASVVLENIHLRKVSTVDELTGLYTFRFFQVVINHEFQKCLRYKTSLSLLMFDIDNFKKINDTHGHQKGNVVLNKIGQIILKNLRSADFPTRYGGEELAILLPNSDVEGAYKCAENLRKLIEKENFFMTADGPFNATVSIGVSSFPSMNMTSVEDMIKFADAALYKAKKEGKNKAIIYSEGT